MVASKQQPTRFNPTIFNVPSTYILRPSTRTVTADLLRRRAEHNDGQLATLEELTLHQFDIERIAPVLQMDIAWMLTAIITGRLPAAWAPWALFRGAAAVAFTYNFSADAASIADCPLAAARLVADAVVAFDSTTLVAAADGNSGSEQPRLVLVLLDGDG